MSSNSYCLIILLSCLPAKTACFCRIYIQVYNQKNEGIRSVIVTYLGLFMCTAYEMSVMHRAKNWLHVSLNAFGYCNKFTNLPFWEDKARIKETRQIFHTICQNLFFSFWHFFLYFFNIFKLLLSMLLNLYLKCKQEDCVLRHAIQATEMKPDWRGNVLSF